MCIKQQHTLLNLTFFPLTLFWKLYNYMPHLHLKHNVRMSMCNDIFPNNKNSMLIQNINNIQYFLPPAEGAHFCPVVLICWTFTHTAVMCSSHFQYTHNTDIFMHVLVVASGHYIKPMLSTPPVQLSSQNIPTDVRKQRTLLSFLSLCLTLVSYLEPLRPCGGITLTFIFS